jgi:uncharacterized protein YqgC (DUF456 family)
MWEWVWYILTFFVLVAGLFINLLGLPGLWLMLAVAGVYAFMTDLLFLGWKSLAALFILAVGAEIVEFVAGAAGAKTAGGSKRGMVGAIVGGLIGGVLGTFIPVPIVGTLVGLVVGAFVGAAGVEYMVRKDVEHSMRVGIGAAKGRFWGTVFKSAFGIAMLILAMITGFPR